MKPLCAWYRRALARHTVLGDSPPAGSRLAAHVAHCSACRRAWNDLRGVAADLPRALTAPVPSESFTHAVWSRVDAVALQRRSRRLAPALSALAAATALCAVAGIAFVERDQGPGTRATSTQGPATSATYASIPRDPLPRRQRNQPPHVGPHTPEVVRDDSRRQIVPSDGQTAKSHVLPPGAGPSGPPPAKDELGYMNGEAVADLSRWGSLRPDETARLEQEVERSVRGGEDFVYVPFPPIAGLDKRAVSAAITAYQHEKEIVDPRLARKVGLGLKATAFSDLCRGLAAQTGIELRAGRGVADEKATVFCHEQPLRDLMRQVTHVFGFRWARDGEPGAYRYELVQDLRSQFAEEELRNRDLHAALLALDEQMAALRQKSQTDLGRNWGAVKLYHLLSPAERAALANGEYIEFSTNSPNPDRMFPPELHKPLLESSGLHLGPTLNVQSGPPLSQVPNAQVAVGLSIDRTELGEVSLRAMSGGYVGSEDGGGRAGSVVPLAVGKSPSVARPDNAEANKALRDQPLFRHRVSLLPKPSCPQFAPGSRPDATSAEPLSFEERFHFNDRGETVEGPEPPHVQTADVWEEVHGLTGLNIVADSYSHYYPLPEATLPNVSLFDALCRLGDTLGVRWAAEGDWLQCRSTSFFWDKLKEVPNRYLVKWQQDRKARGGLPLEDLLEMAALSDQQLDSAISGKVIEHCWGLKEWGMIGKGALRMGIDCHELRTYARWFHHLSPKQLQLAMRPEGMAFEELTSAQQMVLSAGGFGRYYGLAQTPPGLRFRVEYAPAGLYVWEPIAPSADKVQEIARQPLVSGKTPESVLAAARQIDAGAARADIHRCRGMFVIGFQEPNGHFWSEGRTIFIATK